MYECANARKDENDKCASRDKYGKGLRGLLCKPLPFYRVF